MFQDLKDKYRTDQLAHLKRLARETDDVPALESEFADEVIQHQAYLDMHDEYQKKLISLRNALQQQQSRNRQLSDQHALEQTKFECLVNSIKMQSEQNKKQYDLDLLFYASQIQKLKTVISSLKTNRQQTPRERELSNLITALERRLQDLTDTISEQDKTIQVLRDQRTALMVDALTHKEKKVHQKSNFESEVNSLKNRAQAAERISKELEFKNKHYKEQLENRAEELQEIKKGLREKQQRIEGQMRRFKEQYEQKVEQLERENKTLSNRVIKLDAEAHYQQQIARRYEEEIKQHRQAREIYREQNIKERVVTEKKKQHQSRAVSEDPQERSQRKKSHQREREEPPSARRAQSKDSRPKRKEQPIYRIPANIIVPDLQPRPRYITQVNKQHHCKCLKAEKFRNKLGQANDKIMQLLTQKCKMKLELAHLRRSKAKDLTILEVTGDFDNMVVI